MILLKRLFIILVAYLLAAIASGIVVAFIHFRETIFNQPSVAEQFDRALMYCYFVTLMIVLYAATPTLGVIIYGEWKSVRGARLYVIAGCLIGGVLPLFVDIVEFLYLVPVGLAFGPVAGWIYWIIAGRRAGLWRTGLA